MSEINSGADTQPLQAHQPTSGSAAITPSEVRERRGQKAAPRLYHKKSRTGCQRCRARRVKVCEPNQVTSGALSDPYKALPPSEVCSRPITSGLSLAASDSNVITTKWLIYTMFHSAMRFTPRVEAASGIDFHAAMTAAPPKPRLEKFINPLNPIRFVLYMTAPQSLPTTRNRKSVAYWSSD